MEALEESLHAVLGAEAIFLPVLRYREEEREKRLNKRRRKENKSVWTWVLSPRISFYSSIFFQGRWTCWLESFTRKKVKSKKTHPTASPCPPSPSQPDFVFGTVESEVDAKSCCSKVHPKCLITAFLPLDRCMNKSVWNTLLKSV